VAEPDPLAALVSFLRADEAIAERLGSRVFAGELPREENDQMPRMAIVLNPAGGGLIGNGYQAYGDKRIDVDCYGQTKRESWLLYLDLHAALKGLRRAVHEEVLLHWARLSSGGRALRDPRTDWPLTISSWQILASEIPVSA
jgi:hypothetical protein